LQGLVQPPEEHRHAKPCVRVNTLSTPCAGQAAVLVDTGNLNDLVLTENDQAVVSDIVYGFVTDVHD